MKLFTLPFLSTEDLIVRVNLASEPSFLDEFDVVKQTALHYCMTNSRWGVMETLIKVKKYKKNQGFYIIEDETRNV